MSAALARRKQALGALGIGFAVLLAAIAVSLWQTRSAGLASVPDSLTPRLTGSPELTAEIEVTTGDEHFRLRRTLEGWALVSHDGYRADAELAERVIDSLARLRPVGERTRLVSRYAELGIGAPEEGGEATHVVLRDNNDRVLADLLIGRQRPDGHVYVRRADEAQGWLVQGFLPDFAEASRWMQLDFLALGREGIRETCVLPADELGYCLQRPSLASEQFRIASPRGYRLVSPGAGDGVATTLARVRFRGVRPASEITGPRDAEHRVTTVNGLEVTVSVFERDNEFWAELVAVAHSDAARPAAIALNERADGWAFLLSDLTVDRLIRPLSGLAVQVSDEAGQP
ncbi:DUF4340 domain-containing protein [Hyphobacterium sp. HN65]|uniref:DUF4340 domain-containing protein n=1 Tax=Hyphobacterium lacteum TaxID=3116575 RepID=A0ABU7LS66_9PROT|nr:DUF4340 domain-containing protein [Hyphobacterium sp. HN65]MEE2526744.1 DUF4340 domain-containing protein [Hyphobacterium sp. HN65]